MVGKQVRKVDWLWILKDFRLRLNAVRRQGRVLGWGTTGSDLHIGGTTPGSHGRLRQ